MQFKWIFLTLVLALGVTACASFGTSSTPTPSIPTDTPLPPTPTPPPSVATVNGEYLTVAEFEAELERYKSAQTALGLSFTEEDAEKAVLEDMIAQILLEQAAAEENFTLSDADLQSRIDALGGADALQQWQSAHGYDDASFRVALKRSIAAAWMRDKIIAAVPASTEQIHLRQILTYNETDAQSALQELNAGTDFDELAALYDPVTRGELGWVPQGYLLDANADQAVFVLQAGQVSGIVPTQAGFHIFKAVERGEHVLSPDALLTMQELALQKWLADRRAASEITLSP
ncbi:MAG TPA: SurA N-terminal domain-containing protein [Anaerolineales bacterium]|nr:SurA N-terminal domain-containing protein [Anaerolineales bacterium]HNN13523.1 SurA N-terminal domain-containing protein [Anaerolineales bacterium]HNO31334.1 SurA N-terminal domain-containing protein [Anaerolineales bacterium]